MKPIFIIGSPRSGTSVLTWSLGQHPNIKHTTETAWIASFLVGAYLSYRTGSERGKFSHLSNAGYPIVRFLHHIGTSVDNIVDDAFSQRCEQLYGDAGAAINSHRNIEVKRSVDDPKIRWIDGTPLNTHYILPLSRAFPEAKFIHNLRNPLDVALSLEEFDKVGRDAVPRNLKDGLGDWMAHVNNAHLAEKALGESRVFRADFDRFESDTESLLKDILSFLEEDYCSDCMLPFNERLNSSQVDEKRKEKVTKRMSRDRTYRRAAELFNTLQEHPAGIPDAEALKAIEDQFEDQLNHRRLLH